MTTDKEKIIIEGSQAIATSPEGQTATMPLAALIGKLAEPALTTGSLILPDGVKAVLSDGLVTIWIHESPPRPYHFQWIANDSPVPFGRGTQYRSVRLTLPYLIIFAVFVRGPRGQLQLSGKNECFFRCDPLKSLEDELCYPALLNCSKFNTPDGNPLSWICTQYLRANDGMRSPDDNIRLRAGFEALRHCMLETAFNYSSEHHEGSSWFTESRQVDPRISSVEAWEAASEQEPFFVLDVSWLKTGHTVGQVARRIFHNLQRARRESATAGALARLIFNQPKVSL